MILESGKPHSGPFRFGPAGMIETMQPPGSQPVLVGRDPSETEKPSMRGPFRIEGYAIISADGMIADAAGLMPDSLKIEADQRFYEDALDRVTVVAHGRLSHEGQP